MTKTLKNTLLTVAMLTLFGLVAFGTGPVVKQQYSKVDSSSLIFAHGGI